ncbi:MAG: antibiotic biosynthesis monooxygenase [Saprospiraceae bacterium]|nr:antibiotic biosynthesis monooxygenase [Saprospiraceae bacterium]
MILIHVSVQPQIALTVDFEQVLNEIVLEARRVPGCLKYEWYRATDAPNSYVIFGEFDTKAHFEQYLQSNVVKRIGRELIPLLETKPAFKHYEGAVFKEG